jgi:antitoxin HigA-1
MTVQRVRTHPGEVLREEFMKPMGLTANKLAMNLRIPATRIGEIIHERRGVSAETAMRLARYLGTTPEFWLNLQTAYDLSVARAQSAKQIDREIQPVSAP